MAFELRVEFSGLCLYLLHPNRRRVAVLMPDCRKTTADPRHADGTDGVFHVGYLRFNLANLGVTVPPGDNPSDPKYEVVHRFDREVLDLGVDMESPPMTLDLEFPAFEQFAPTLQLIPGLFSVAPPAPLLMRTVLNGGILTARPEAESWQFSDRLNPNGTAYAGQFASFATWTRRIEGDDLPLRIARFDGSAAVEIPLHRVGTSGDGAVVTLKVANLCAENPLEWNELKLRPVVGADLDFKWLYRLLEPQRATYAELLNGSELPVPEPTGPQPMGIRQDCMGAQRQYEFA